MKVKLLVFIIGAIFLVPAGNSLAQGSGVLEEIVVTAQKREETLFETPLAVSVISGEDMEKDRLHTMQDISGQTPGLVFTAFVTGQPEISMRGISTKEDGASASDSVIVSVDDVYIAARTAQVFDLFDLERVEVVKGPHATLFGRNSIGGAINFVTLKPSQEKILRLQQTFGNHGIKDTGFLASGPLNDELAAKISFIRRAHTGWLNNLLTDREEGGGARYGMRSQAVWTPASDLEFVFTADGAFDRTGQTNREPIGSQGPLHNCPCAANPIAVNEALGGAGKAFNTLAETEGFTDREIIGASLKTTWNFADWGTLVSITAYRYSHIDWLEDSEGLPPTETINLFNVAPGTIDLARLTGPPSSGFSFDVNDMATEGTHQATQELRLLSRNDGPFSWFAGLFYSYEDIERTESFFFPALGFGPEPDFERSIQKNETNSVAGYFQLQYDLLDDLTATFGARYSYEKKDARIGAEILNNNPMAVLLAGAPFPDTDGDGVRDGLASASKSFNSFDWRAALNYTVSEDISLFVNIATGFKSGGFSGSPSTLEVATTPFKEEDATNYEFGMRSRWFGNRLAFDISGFLIDYEDLQVTRFFQPITSQFGEFITENAGEADISGIELEVAALPFQNVEVGGTYAYLDATFSDFTGSPSIAADGTVTDPGDFNGNRLRISPKHSASGYLRINYSLGEYGSLAGNFKVQFRDKIFFDPDNNPINVSPSYTIFDLWTAYTTPDERWEVKLWIKNISNKEYVTHGFTQRGSRVAFGVFGEPRTYGATVTYNFF